MIPKTSNMPIAMLVIAKRYDRLFEANSYSYFTRMSGKMGQNDFSAVGSLFSDSLLGPVNNYTIAAMEVIFSMIRPTSAVYSMYISEEQHKDWILIKKP